MLVLTEAAAEVVKSVIPTPQTPGETGLRIVSSAPEPEDPGALQITAAAGPGENDQVIEAAGARVFLEPQAAAYLDDKVDRKSTRLNSSHSSISYAVFCLKKKK